MKCPKCSVDNKEGAKACKKCGGELVAVPLWRPTMKWHLSVLGIIYVCLLGLFFVLNMLLKPYMRQIPKDITPWLQATTEKAGSAKPGTNAAK